MRRATVLEPVQDVADHGAGRRSDDPDHPRQEGQRPLALGIEEAFRGERSPALLEQGHERAFAGQLQPVDDDLVFGAARIGGELAGGDDLQPIGRLERQSRPPGRAR